MMLTKEEGPNEFGNKLYTFGNTYTLEVPKHYKVLELIGRGSYGVVCSAINSTSGEYVAIKKIKNVFESEAECGRILREVTILRDLEHPNILSLRDIFAPPSAGGLTDLYVVSDLMQQDLLSLLRRPRCRLAAGHCQYLALQLLFALRYLASAGVLHRDLKPGNLLLDADCTLRLGDFGLARRAGTGTGTGTGTETGTGTGTGTAMTAYVVTRWYRAPELLLECARYGHGVDLWSVGCLAAEMVTGAPLFRGQDYIDQLTRIAALLGPPDIERDLPDAAPGARTVASGLSKQVPHSLEEILPELKRRFFDDSFFDSFDSDEETAQKPSTRSPNEYYEQFEDFVMGFLKYKPDARLTASEAIMHPWLDDIRNERPEWEGFKTTVPLALSHENYAQLSIKQLRKLLIDEIDKFHATNTRDK